MSPARPPPGQALRLRRIGIDTCQEPVVYLHADAPACRSLHMDVRARLDVWRGDQSMAATLHVVHGTLLAPDELGLSESAWRMLGGADGETVHVGHPETLLSLPALQAKLAGEAIADPAAARIVADIGAGRLAGAELAALVTACSGSRLDLDETCALAQAMAASGLTLDWAAPLVLDQRSGGGVPGNRTALLVTPIVAACGLLLPHFSPRAVAWPSGGADAMATLAPVVLDAAAARRVVAREGACIAWGGALPLAPAEALLRRVERPLGLDGAGLLAASILARALAAGVNRVLVELPVGRTARLRSAPEASALWLRLQAGGTALGMTIGVRMTDGEQPVGAGIGPALEAHDVLAVLQNGAGAPDDLRRRSLLLAGEVLELAGHAAPGAGLALAGAVLASGAAWGKFQAICAAQGGLREPGRARYTRQLLSEASGQVVAVDNRALARAARLAGAPAAAAAGLVFHAHLGSRIAAGQPLLTLHAETAGELAYAFDFARAQEQLVTLSQPG